MLGTSRRQPLLRYAAPRRFAVISDIHGNLLALEAVLADARRHGAEMIVNLGDIVSGPLQPRETAERLMELNIPTIKGNHERQLLTLEPRQMGPSDRAARSDLSPSQLAWLEALPASIWLTEKVFLCHGTPKCDLEYFLHTVTSSGLREATQMEVDHRAATAADAALILCGHTHLPAVRKSSMGQLIVNPGAVGLQAYEEHSPFPHIVQTGSPEARYAILERVNLDEWTADLRTVEYDQDAAAGVAASVNRSDWEVALRTGRYS